MAQSLTREVVFVAVLEGCRDLGDDFPIGEAFKIAEAAWNRLAERPFTAREVFYQPKPEPFIAPEPPKTFEEARARGDYPEPMPEAPGPDSGFRMNPGMFKFPPQQPSGGG